MIAAIYVTGGLIGSTFASVALIATWTMLLAIAWHTYAVHRTAVRLKVLAVVGGVLAACYVLAFGAFVIWATPDVGWDPPLIFAVSLVRAILLITGIWLLWDRRRGDPSL